MAVSILLRPSKLNGFSTMAIVRAPRFFAIPAITGEAPVPVPPPIPAVMKTMSAPARCSCSKSTDSSAAFLPICGFPPLPNPRVISSPMRNLISALLFAST